MLQYVLEYMDITQDTIMEYPRLQSFNVKNFSKSIELGKEHPIIYAFKNIEL